MLTGFHGDKAKKLRIAQLLTLVKNLTFSTPPILIQKKIPGIGPLVKVVL